MGARVAASRLLLLMVVLVAGCSKPAPAGAPLAPSATPTDEAAGSAAVRGVAVDENQLPVAGAIASVAGRSAVSDETGAFVLDGLPDGEVVVTVRAQGFFDAARPLRLAPGQVVELTFELVRLPDTRPFQRTLVAEGFLACNVPGSIYVDENPCPDAAQEGQADRFVFPFEASGLAAVLYEATWTSSWPEAGARTLGHLDLQLRAPDGASLAGRKGFEYIALEAEPALVLPKEADASPETHVYVRVPPPNVQGAQGPGDPEGIAQSLVGGAAYQQRFTLHVTFAYHGPLPRASFADAA